MPVVGAALLCNWLFCSNSYFLRAMGWCGLPHNISHCFAFDILTVYNGRVERCRAGERCGVWADNTQGCWKYHIVFVIFSAWTSYSP